MGVWLFHQVRLCPPSSSVAVHRQGSILHHIIHRQVLEPAELRPLIPSSQFDEEEQGDDGCSDDEDGH